MKVHHLDCCTMCPVGGRWVNRAGHLVGHCLLIETAGAGLVLIDTGIGTADVAEPGRRLGRPFNTLVRPRMSVAQTALGQVEALGFTAADVAHIIPTHLDLDHAGGLGDFPAATVHVHAAELDAALNPHWRERTRYRPLHWSHSPKWRTFDSGGEGWFGFEAVRAVPGLDESILVVPLPGHTRGHVAVAVEDGERWWLHCGDAYFHEHSVDQTRPTPGPLLRAFAALTAADRALAEANRDRLRELRSVHEGTVQLFCAHDPAELERAQVVQSS
ncbi:MAG: MBL fold metallo-hydrolase [Acidimicrobiia bacterium]|nr:MBL fold metallo-hydrolase [Acidimicrobiia bacterium]